uniref:Uncharacterized protein n=1 Tax=Anguilla anguilla TaxID=7936 RepID=A0A0E9QE22_ANGAN
MYFPSRLTAPVRAQIRSGVRERSLVQRTAAKKNKLQAVALEYVPHLINLRSRITFRFVWMFVSGQTQSRKKHGL